MTAKKPDIPTRTCKLCGREHVIAVAAIRTAPWNPRTITKDALENLKRSIQADPGLFCARPVLVRIDPAVDYLEAYAGNMRFEAARSIGNAWLRETYGSDGIPAQAEEISADEARQRGLRDNGHWGDWQDQQLAEMLFKMKEGGAEIDTLGFDDKEISRLLDSVSGTNVGGADEDDVTPPETPETAVGDLIELGRHRLICGDATDTNVLLRLMKGDSERPKMAFTDPPWNVEIGGDNNPRHRQRPLLQNDGLSQKDFDAFLKKTSVVLAELVAGDIYVVMGSEQWPTIDAALRSAGFHWSGTIVWAKDIFVLGRSNYHTQYEPIWYGWPKKAKSSFNGDRGQSNLWQIDRPRKSEEHASMKPIELVERTIKNSSERGDIVLDLFGGSGTTLLAAEANDRACRMAEIEPGFADVIVRRWEKMTGAKAIRQGPVKEAV